MYFIIINYVFSQFEILTFLSEDDSRPPINVRRKYCMIRYIMYARIVGCVIRNMYFCVKMDMKSSLLYACYLEALTSYLDCTVLPM